MGQPIVNVVADGQTGDAGAEFAAGIATATAAQAANDAAVAEIHADAAERTAVEAVAVAASTEGRLSAVEARLDAIEGLAVEAAAVAEIVAEEILAEDGPIDDPVEAAGGPEIVAAGDVKIEPADDKDKPDRPKKGSGGDWFFGSRPRT